MSCAIAIVNWRTGILLAILIDAVCDPIRKLTPDEPLWVSHIVVGTWGCILFAALSRKKSIRKQFRRMFPGVAKAGVVMTFALLPAAGLSFLMYENGWFLVLIGTVSYVTPLLGILVGAQYARNPADLRRFMVVYTVANGVMLSGCLAEQFHWSWPALGGLANMEWIRHMPGVLVRLISGFYRSPDMAGFHAAHVGIFSFILAAPRRSGDTPKLQWIAVMMLALFCLFLTGRRKMFGLPAVFFLAWLVVTRLRKGKQSGLGSAYLILGVTMFVAVTIGFTLFISNDVSYEDHGIYLATTVMDTAPKLFDSVQSVVGTVAQSGVLGSGLGVATQGNKYAGLEHTRAWQEDGTSRLFKELGVPGVLLFFIAVTLILNEAGRSLRFALPSAERDLLRTVGLAIFAANAAGYVISHQHISGSVPNAIMPILFLGMALGQVVYGGQSTDSPARSGPA